jgi:hypothetical protein
VEHIASSVFENALGSVPLVKGILSLFGGGDSRPPETPLVKYVLPPSVHFQAAETAAGFSASDFDQTGQARTFGSGESTQSRMPVLQGAQQVTVQVQAMDARSFLDRSSEIAAAVRNAMLNLNSINDVVSDL